MSDLVELLSRLSDFGVEFIIVGGVAAVVHGSSRLSQDLDIVYRRTPQSIDKLVSALTDLDPYPRGAPPGLPFRWDTATLQRGLNFTLRTRLGDLDLFGEIAGGGRFEDLLPHTIQVRLFGREVRCLDLPTLVRVKRAAGRPRDFEVIAELEEIWQEAENGES